MLSTALRTPIALALGALLLSACQKEEQQASPPSSPPAPKVAVFDQGVLDTLLALNVEVACIAPGAMPAYLAEQVDLEQMTQVGTLFEPNMEALEACAPDLILLGRRSAGHQETLSQLATTLDMTIAPDAFIEGVLGQIEQLGQLFDRQTEAAQLAQDLEQQLQRVQQQSQAYQSATLLFTVNGHILPHAPGDRYGMLNEVLGLSSTVAPLGITPPANRPEAGTPEAIALQEAQALRLATTLEAQPDWLLILDRNGATGGEPQAEATLSAHAGVQATQAWQQGQVFYLDAPTWYVATGGYQGLMMTLSDLEARLGSD